jgi:hypothetical protein|tara:strand:+ start:8240 stop:8488 length:249 start_codon:yes stop_codon:yes gene_type:complete
MTDEQFDAIMRVLEEINGKLNTLIKKQPPYSLGPAPYSIQPVDAVGKEWVQIRPPNPDTTDGAYVDDPQFATAEELNRHFTV